MAKTRKRKRNAPVEGTNTVEDQRRWQAEEIVRRKLTASPDYKKQVKEVMVEQEKIEKKLG